jgi:hypothetical protein
MDYQARKDMYLGEATKALLVDLNLSETNLNQFCNNCLNYYVELAESADSKKIF